MYGLQSPDASRTKMIITGPQKSVSDASIVRGAAAAAIDAFCCCCSDFSENNEGSLQHCRRDES